MVESVSRRWVRRVAAIVVVGALVSAVTQAARREHGASAEATTVEAVTATAWLSLDHRLVLADATRPRAVTSRVALAYDARVTSVGSSAVVTNEGSMSVVDGATWALANVGSLVPP